MKFSALFIFFTLVTMLLFALYPTLDIQASALFYKDNEGFYLSEYPLFEFLHDKLGLILGLSVGMLLVLFLYQWFFHKVVPYFDKKAIGFLILFLLLGPGLITNVFFKEYSGRVRPVKIVEFGGSKVFTPYYKISDQCKTNCSFISGHAAAGFFFLAFAYVMRSRVVFYLALTFGILMSITRVVQGGHFLSDVLFAFIVNFIILKVLYFWMYKKGASLA